jgi:UPF0755 protein
MPRDPRVEKLQRLRNERTTRATGGFYNTRATAYGNVPQGPRQRNAGRTVLSLVLFVAIVAVAFSLLGQVVLHDIRPVAAQQARRVTFTVTPNESPGDVAQRLQDGGLVVNNTLFYLYLRATGATILAGPHTLNTSMTMGDVAQALAQASPAAPVATVTIYPGWRAEQVARALADAGVASYDDVMRAVQHGTYHYPFLSDHPPATGVEGYLLPDTYQFRERGGASYAIGRILDTFAAKVPASLVMRGQKTYGSFYDAMIMASIVQREAGTRADTALIASTLLNRLHDRTGQYPNLGADATVQYVVGRAPTWWRDPTSDDLAAAAHSRFDTRVFAGLPPAPIAEPDVATIAATVDPPSTPYFSYRHIAGSHGKSIFCTVQEGVGCQGTPQ